MLGRECRACEWVILLQQRSRAVSAAVPWRTYLAGARSGGVDGTALLRCCADLGHPMRLSLTIAAIATAMLIWTVIMAVSDPVERGCSEDHIRYSAGWVDCVEAQYVNGG